MQSSVSTSYHNYVHLLDHTVSIGCTWMRTNNKHLILSTELGAVLGSIFVVFIFVYAFLYWLLISS